MWEESRKDIRKQVFRSLSIYIYIYISIYIYKLLNWPPSLLYAAAFLKRPWLSAPGSLCNWWHQASERSVGLCSDSVSHLVLLCHTVFKRLFCHLHLRLLTRAIIILLTVSLLWTLLHTVFFLQTFSCFFFPSLHTYLPSSLFPSLLPFIYHTFLPSLYHVLSPFPPSLPAPLHPGTAHNLLCFPTTPFFFIMLPHLPILVPVDKAFIGPYVESTTLRSRTRGAMYGHGKSPKDKSQPDRTVMRSDSLSEWLSASQSCTSEVKPLTQSWWNRLKALIRVDSQNCKVPM